MRILLATDFSHCADVARDLVKTLALPAGSRIRLVHVIEPVTTLAMFAPAAVPAFTEAADAEANAAVAVLARQLERPGVTADAVVAFGRAADGVIDECASFAPDLVVVGSRGRGGIAASLLGSVSAEIVDRAPCPVLVARRAKLSTIVLAEDGSPFAAAGARSVADLVPLRSAYVRVVSVVDVPLPVVFSDPSASGAAVDAYRAYEEAMPRMRETSEALARDRAKALAERGIRATAIVREGDAANELIDVAHELHADCVVVGSRGQTGLRRLVLGSVARSVLFHAPCSVLVVHDHTGGRAVEGAGEAPAVRA